MQTNTPLSSNDQAKILIFGLLLLPTIPLFLLGVIPVILIAFGVFMMKKNSDFSHIETAVGYFQAIVTLGMAVATVFFMIYMTELRQCESNCYSVRNEAIISVSCMGIAGFYLFICSVLFHKPLRRHRDWVEKNGIFSNKPRTVKQESEVVDISIIRGEKLKTFSVADELLKWAKLKEEGLISEQEFNEARKKLLHGN
jgi:hypothetical protein